MAATVKRRSDMTIILTDGRHGGIVMGENTEGDLNVIPV